MSTAARGAARAQAAVDRRERGGQPSQSEAEAACMLLGQQSKHENPHKIWKTQAELRNGRLARAHKKHDKGALGDAGVSAAPYVGFRCVGQLEQAG